MDAPSSFAEGLPGEHIPVLYEEALQGLMPVSPGSYVDATVGLGGHSAGILERSLPEGRLLALDADPVALEKARVRLTRFGARAEFAQSWHRDLADSARKHGFSAVHGILLDLGVSSLQLDDPERGFSFREDGPLDMRIGPDADVTADELINSLDEEALAHIIFTFGEERLSRRIARAIRQERPIHSTRHLADLIAKVIGRRGRIHPATRTFQALRIAVNKELESLEAVLPQAVELLKPGGRLVVIAFHSLEDRIVKRFLVQESRDCVCPPRAPQCVCDHRATLSRITKKPLRPSEDEVERNPRSRSARMRVAERV